jgi:hypothetical protein
MVRVVQKGKQFQHVAVLRKRAPRDGADALVWAKSGKGASRQGKTHRQARQWQQDPFGAGGAVPENAGFHKFPRGGARNLLPAVVGFWNL